MMKLAEGRFQLDIFTNVGRHGDNYLHNEGEANIINLPAFGKYDGIIVAPDTLGVDGMYEDCVKRIEAEAHCPVVAIRCRDPKFYNVLTDDLEGMKGVVRHFITVHNCKRICFMTGRLELEDACVRLQCYRDVMKEYNLPVTEHMIFEGDYWRLKGEEAVAWFLDNDEGKPDAIVCANDYMALSVLDALTRRGIKVPDEIKLSGYDNIEEAQYVEPRVASVDVPLELMAGTAVDKLERLMNNEEVQRDDYIQVNSHFEGSCGCPINRDPKMYSELYSQKERFRQLIYLNTYMNSDFESCVNLDELMSISFRYSYNFDYQYIYLCLCERDNSDDDRELLDDESVYTDRMILQGFMSREDGQYHPVGVDFDREDILPENFRKLHNSLIVFPLHYKNTCLGYIVIVSDDTRKMDACVNIWLQTIANSLDKVSIIETNRMYRKYREQSLMDELTGIYNRRAIESMLKRGKYNKNSSDKLYIMSIDIDGLKNINDTYGHLEGDETIRALADILKTVSGETVKPARVGGDEFMVYITGVDASAPRDIKEEIQYCIEEYNRTSGKAFELSASIGFAEIQNSTLGRCIREADRRMYAEKAEKKKEQV